MMKSHLLWIAAVSALALGCADEDPTSVGGPLLPGGDIRTFEVVMDAAAFLASDTSASGYTRPSQFDTLVVANDFAGVLDAHALIRFAPPPRAVTYRTVTDSVRVDSMPSFTGGRVVLRVDTLRFEGTRPILFTLYRIAESWDPITATWTLRVDSAGEQLAWSQPGGTRGEVVGTASWTVGTDSLSFDVDSQTVALWADTASTVRGAMLVAETPGTRILVATPVLRLNARPSARPDTIVTVQVGAQRRTYVYDPPPPPTDALRIGGNPAWRAFLTFAEALGQSTIPCDASVEGACARFEDVTINHAALLLRPAAVHPAFLPEGPVQIEARRVFNSPFVPLPRSPISTSSSGTLQGTVPRDAFVAGTGEYELPITSFFAAMVAQSADTAATAVRVLALRDVIEGRRFGLAEFGGATGPAPVRLRVVYTRVLNTSGAE